MSLEKTIILATDSNTEININANKIPEENLNRLARGALRGVQDAFKDPEFAERFRVWQEARHNA